MIGWSAVIGRRSYTSAGICSEYTELLRVRGADLQTLCNQHPDTGNQFVDRLAEVVAERLQSSHPQVLQLLENGLRNRVRQEVKDGMVADNNVPESTAEERMQTLIDRLSAYIEQYLGGSVEMVDFDGEVVKVKLGGACLGCPLLPSTLHGWVEGTIRQFFPKVRVEAVS